MDSLTGSYYTLPGETFSAASDGGKHEMMRLVKLLAVLISMHVLLQGSSAHAADERSSFEPPDEIRGMLVLKLPFGGAKTFSAPRLGFDFQMQRKSDLDYLKESYDPETGRRLPEIDTGGMRTWTLDLPDFILPDKAQDEPETHEPHHKPLPLS